MDEKKLIEQSLSGNKTAFNELFRKYSDQIKRSLIHLSNNEFDSNDLLQETFIKAFINLKRYDSKYPFGVWLMAIARNTFLDYARKNKLKNKILTIDSQKVSEMEIEDNDNVTLLNERNETLDKRIISLDEKYKVVMELRYNKGLSYKDIAEELNMPISTVKTRIARGKSKVMKDMKED